MKTQRFTHALLALLLVAALLAACAPGKATPTAAEAPPASGQPTAQPVTEPTPAQAAAPGRLILATTTSTADSGLLSYLLPSFEALHNCKVDVIAVGTGQAIKTGESGDCDVILVHARAAEDQFVADGHGINRLDVMYNDFVIVGPADDPAGIAGLADAVEALQKIAAAEARFVSRGDDSGTHKMELGLWKEADITPAAGWYISAGQGMGAVLNMANEQLAYTLTDRATYLAQRAKLDLVIVVEADPKLFNPYGVIAVNPEKHPGVNSRLAAEFQAWLTSLETQELIAGFGVAEYGQPLFVPDSDAWRQAHPPSAG